MKYLICLITTTLAVGWIPPCQAAEAKQPNILLIFCDDLGYGDLGVFHQNKRSAQHDRNVPSFTTPHIDALANEGMKFDQHYCGAPVCAPSRATLLSGQHQGHSGRRDNQFDQAFPDTHTLASVVKEAGYATAAFGKWGLQGKKEDRKNRKPTPPGQVFPDWPTMPMDRGFDYFLGYVRHRDGHYHYPVEDQKQIWENTTEISEGMELCFTTDLFTAATKKWIIEHTENNPTQPFFAYLAYDTPHAKLQNPPCAYPDGGGIHAGVQWIGKKGGMINTAMGKYDAWMHPDYAKATWDHDKNPETAEQPWPDVQRRYANNVRRIDDSVGDLMSLLKDLNLSENTLVIFSSDNGPSKESYIKGSPYQPTFFHGFGPFDGIKRDTLEGGLRVPTIAHWPAMIKAGRRASRPSGHWDWLPTFAEAAGVPTPASSDGVSLMPTLSGQGEQEPSTIYSEYSVPGKTPSYDAFHPSHRGKIRRQMQVVFVDHYKGLRTGIESADDDFEIYHLIKDPQEKHNLAGENGFDDVQKRMKARALQCRRALASAPRPYDHAPIPPTLALAVPSAVPAPQLAGVDCVIRQGAFPWMPDLRQAKRSNPHQLSSFVLPDGITQNFAVMLEALVQFPVDGSYTFNVTSNSHTMLFVHDIRLLKENKKPTGNARSGTLHLKAGWHPVQLLVRMGAGQAALSFDITDDQGKQLPLATKSRRPIK
ncbi:MAG: sulfatase-like hydrolase/transferase [Verrucomicrobiae bacterium]|nr:sulfatase-like hydrolase/transferase [Verrucomicrobiae bacterium]NNJ43109.1 sulfatase-like hydrolase/transferase [Akkermansiaceae bacterium]